MLGTSFELARLRNVVQSRVALLTTARRASREVGILFATQAWASTQSCETCASAIPPQVFHTDSYDTSGFPCVGGLAKLGEYLREPTDLLPSSVTYVLRMSASRIWRFRFAARCLRSIEPPRAFCWRYSAVTRVPTHAPVRSRRRLATGRRVRRRRRPPPPSPSCSTFCGVSMAILCILSFAGCFALSVFARSSPPPSYGSWVARPSPFSCRRRSLVFS